MAKIQSRLAQEMTALVGICKGKCKDGQLTHWEICRDVASQFDLWDNEGRFPIWLSRIVEGVIADTENGEIEVV